MERPTPSSAPGATRDKAGRPIVAVTGIGVVTSLGVGKADNWAKLSGGDSGIRRISRFSTDGLKTTMAGTVNDVYKDNMAPAELSERMALLAGEEAIAQSGIGSKGHFPGPLCLAPPPLELEWSDTIPNSRDGREQYGCDLCGPGARCPPIRRELRSIAIRRRGRAPRRAFRHRGIAHIAQHRLRVGRNRDPVGARSHSARRMRRGAGRRSRWIGDAEVAGALLAALRAFDPERSAGAGLEAVFQEPRRLRDG